MGSVFNFFFPVENIITLLVWLLFEFERNWAEYAVLGKKKKNIGIQILCFRTWPKGEFKFSGN